MNNKLILWVAVVIFNYYYYFYFQILLIIYYSDYSEENLIRKLVIYFSYDVAFKVKSAIVCIYNISILLAHSFV